MTISDTYTGINSLNSISFDFSRVVCLSCSLSHGSGIEGYKFLFDVHCSRLSWRNGRCTVINHSLRCLVQRGKLIQLTKIIDQSIRFPLASFEGCPVRLRFCIIGGHYLVAFRLLFLLPSLFAIDVLGEVVQRALENLLDLANLTLALFLVVLFLVVALDHVNQLVDVAAGDDYVAHFFLGLHLLPHHELVGPVLANDARIDSFFRVFFDLLSQ